jgi:Pyruvate/2-oxoacid:ferredoxin oxidoreductase delta subunit
MADETEKTETIEVRREIGPHYFQEGGTASDKTLTGDISLLDKFAAIFELPPAMREHVAFVADEREMALVVWLGERTVPLEEAAAWLGMPPGEADAYLEGVYQRQIIHRHRDEDGNKSYSAGTFYHRLDPLSMYENWADVPAEAREQVLDWQLQEFIDLWMPVVEQMKADPDAARRIPNSDYLLLDEALEIVDAAEEHVVVPCDCRALVMACNRPLEACIRLDAGARCTLDAGQGRVLTKEECRQIVIDADRHGLMHTGPRNWRDQDDLFGFCNCCADDCYPIRAGVKLGMVNEWPRSHYIAQRDVDTCIMCGKCARRCHFGAFYFDGTRTEVNGKPMRTVRFDPAKCVGCGLCATGCSTDSIEMMSLAGQGGAR